MEKLTYSIEMAKKIRQIKVPVKNLWMDLRARPNYIAITVYESNIMEYNEMDRMAIMEYLLLVRQLIQSYGTPCEIEGMKYTDEQARKRRRDARK
jgi:predicted methyltransferase